MSRCKVCNKIYSLNFISQFPGEDYCPTCEGEIMVCLMELEELEEVEDET